MGPLDDIKALAGRIVPSWNKELYKLVCGHQSDDRKDRQAVLDALQPGQGAVIAAVAAALLNMGVAAAIAAPLAPLIVSRFVWPAKDELCDAWQEAIGE